MTTALMARLVPNPDNRDTGTESEIRELAASIKAQGLLVPPLVQAAPGQPGFLLILDGERRYRACNLLGWPEMPVTVRERAGANEIAVLRLVANCQRKDMSPVEKAEDMGRLLAAKWTRARISKETGLSPSAVAYHLSLLDLDQGTRDRIRKGTVKAGEARAAVRQVRANTARANGHKPRQQRVTVEADHFSVAHPLAEQARVRCELAGHTGRKLGRSGVSPGACGACWEAEIRADERTSSRSNGNGHLTPAAGTVTFRSPASATADLVP